MAYTTTDYPTKKALKEAIKAGIAVCVFEPGLGRTPVDGTVYLEGPHYPRPHTWYAVAELKGGLVVRVK